MLKCAKKFLLKIARQPVTAPPPDRSTQSTELLTHPFHNCITFYSRLGTHNAFLFPVRVTKLFKQRQLKKKDVRESLQDRYC